LKPTDALFQTGRIGDMELPHRIAMAPLTRSRAMQPGNVPYALNARYYAQRAACGAFIVSEAAQISEQGQGYAWTPGIHSDAQVQGWRLVTDAVRQAGGRIFCQLWHVGRISHSRFQPDGGPPAAPSAIRPKGQAFVEDDEGNGALMPFETPRALEMEEIAAIVADYRRAAANAREAGFDGVEIHGANGYLIDQFLCSQTNRRHDSYGGSVEKRSRFLQEVIDAVCEEWPAHRVGLRLSPLGTFNDIDDEDPEALFGYVAKMLEPAGLAYLHVVRHVDSGDGGEERLSERGDRMLAMIRERWSAPLLACGAFSPDEAARWVTEGRCDFAVFGRLFLANPDLPARIRNGCDFNDPVPDTFYGGGAQGYTDYPTLAQAGGEVRPETVTSVDRAGIRPGAGDPMTEAARIAVVRRFWDEVWTGGDTAAIEELVEENFVLHSADQNLWPRKVFGEWLGEFRSAFEDLRVMPKEVFARDDQVFTRWCLEGRLSGRLFGLDGRGRHVRMTGMTLFIVRDGRLREGWVERDALGLARQLGALPRD
jgi:N-ethylmaleimide reductase